MKRVCLSILFFSLVSIFYSKGSSPKINVLPYYTSMVMDAAVYEDTIYEAILALSSDDDDDPYNIFINKYIGTEYDSTISIEIPPQQFTTGEFRENRSHYEHLRVFPIGKDDICVTVYSSFSNCHFTFLRIINGSIVSKKTYNLKNTSSYESTDYSYNGKDTIYFSYIGQSSFTDSSWDTWVMAFDLNGNVKSYKKIYTSEADSISNIVSFPDSVYLNCEFGRYSNKKSNAILKLSPNLSLKEIYPYNYGDQNVPYLNLKKGNNNFSLVFAKYDENKNRVLYQSFYSPKGDFEGSYIEKDLTEVNKQDENLFFSASYFYSDDGFTILGVHESWDNIIQNKNEPCYYDYYKYVNFQKIEGYRFDEPFAYSGEKEFYIDGKLFITGYKTNKSSGISKVSFHTVLENKTKVKDIPFEYLNSDFNVLEKNEASIKKAEDIKDLVLIVNEKVVEEASLATASIIKLPWIESNPDSPEILESIPVLPFSER